MDDNKTEFNAVSTETVQPPLTAPDPAAPQGEERDQALFDAIGRGKRRKKRRRIIITVVILALVAGGITAAVLYGRSRVREQFGDMVTSTVTAYTVDTGSVNTTVSGSGLLSDVDTEKLTLPKGVKVDEVLVEAGDPVAVGQVLATLDRSSVLTVLKETQEKITELDSELRKAAGDSVPTYLNTNVAGRVKAVYAQAEDDVAACMMEHGALALLSLDGYMAVDLYTDALNPGDKVKVLRSDGKELPGTVDEVIGSRATVLVTDNGPALDEVVTVTAADGRSIGSGALYIHNPLRITGYAGTVETVAARENQYFYAGSALFRLKDTAYAANYNALIKERGELEEALVELLAYARAGAVEAPFSGTVSSVEYSKTPVQNETNTQTGSAGMYGVVPEPIPYGSYSTYGGDGTQTPETPAATDETALLTLAPDEKMSVTLNVDETDILALEVGQSAQVTINSIGEMFSGEVTEVKRNASSQSGITSYQAVITVPKDPRMMPGMSARVVVRIQGVAGAILIPEAALHQTRDAAFVYTSYDYETKEFGGAAAVVPGLSNGDMVEIVEGLEEGDTVYYTVVFNPYMYYGFGTGGNASGGDAWVELDASGGDAWTASGGDAAVSAGDAEQ